MLWWVCVSWAAVFGFAVAACIAHDTAGPNLSNKLLLASAFLGVVAGIEVKRGWVGFGLLFVSSCSAFFLGSAVGLEYLRLVLHSPHWFNGVIRATVIGGAALVLSAFLLKSYRKNIKAPLGPMPHNSAAGALIWLDEQERQFEEDQRRRRVQQKMQLTLCSLGLVATIAIGIWRLAGVSFWVSALPAMVLGIACVLLSDKIYARLTRKLLGPRYQKLDESIAELKANEVKFREILLARAAEEARQKGESQ